MYVSPEQRTLASERQSRMRRDVCVLFVVLAALFVITLAISLFALIGLLYQNALAGSFATTPFLPFTTSTLATTTFSYTSTTVPTATGPDTDC